MGKVSGIQKEDQKCQKKKKDTMHEAVYKNTDPTEFRLLILKNTVLNTACEVHLVVWTPVQYKVQKT